MHFTRVSVNFYQLENIRTKEMFDTEFAWVWNWRWSCPFA